MIKGIVNFIKKNVASIKTIGGNVEAFYSSIYGVATNENVEGLILGNLGQNNGNKYLIPLNKKNVAKGTTVLYNKISSIHLLSDGAISIQIGSQEVMNIKSSSIKISKDVSVEGDLEVSGTLSVGELVINGKDFFSHTHSNGAGGNPTGGVIP